MELIMEASQQKKLLNYWRADIKNELMLGIKVDYYQYSQYFVESTTLKEGVLAAEKTQALFKQNKKFLKKIKLESLDPDSNATEEKLEEKTVLPLKISPFVYERKHEHGSYQSSQKKNYIHPIWIFAFLEEDGTLFAEYPCTLAPWISREHLNPVDREQDSTIIGDMSSYDTFLDRNNINCLIQAASNEEKIRKIPWLELHHYAQKMLAEVSPNFKQCLEENGYKPHELEQLLIIPAEDNTNKNYSVTLLKLLDSLAMEDERLNPLFFRYLTLEESAIRAPLSIREQLAGPALAHVGQLTGDFPLAKSQRIALHHLLSMPESEILAINGPPGTGKTALLTNIVASFWVQAALKQELPPLIVISSTNNRAIQNVIDTFENILSSTAPSEDQRLLSKRWVQGVKSFGLYLTNGDPKNYQYYNERKETGTLEEIKSQGLVPTTNYFLENFNKFFQLEVFSVKEAMDLLYQKILDLENSLKMGLKIALRSADIVNRYSKYPEEIDIVIKISALEERLKNMEIDFLKFKNLHIRFEKIIKNLTVFSINYKFLTSFFSFLSDFLEKFASPEIEIFLLSEHLYLEAKEVVVRNYFKNQQKHYRRKIDRTKNIIAAYKKYLSERRAMQQEWESWKNTQKSLVLDWKTAFDFESVEKISADNLLFFLDTKIRWPLFQYAVHYWEARWILDTFTIDQKKDNGGRSYKLNCFKSMAMLAPCFITTMQSGPGFFTSKTTSDQVAEFMKNSIDLLIVDEASQVHPGYGAGMMALAKKACVVGDNLQLPPIVQIPGAVDIGNLQLYKLINNHADYESISRYGANIADCEKNGNGNVMKLAQTASFFQEQHENQSLQERGIFLIEHRRCVPDIIRYCNEFFYKNKMAYKRRPIENHPFPALGYAHILGFEKKIGQSKMNTTEALSIAKWIASEKQNFLTLYPEKTLDQIFGIITPFHPQSHEIKKALKNEGVELPARNVGTIHTFQGAEFPVIIFSPVYSYNPNVNQYFFDRQKTMLNVAVSRAKDHFFVFGDMDIFDPKKPGIPSGFLAQLLLHNKHNELKNVQTVRKFYIENPEIVKHIHSLEDHRKILKNAFMNAKERICLVSPWITLRALKADQVEDLIKLAVARGVKVLIYTDYENNFKKEPFHKASSTIPESLSCLTAAGAELQVVFNVHAKTLFVDNHLFVEGSFNWLSASREHPKYEASICCQGKGLVPLIRQFMKRFENRKTYPLNAVAKSQSHSYVYEQ